MRIPAALPALAIAAGALASLFLAFTPPRWLLISLLAGATVAFLMRRDGATTVLLTIGFACAGGSLTHVADRQARHTTLGEWFHRHVGEGEHQLFARVEGRLQSDASHGEHGVTLNLLADRVTLNDIEHSVSGGVLISVGGGLGADQILHWRSGRRLALPATLRVPTRYLNPGAEDTVRSLAWRGTTLVGSVKSDRLVEVAGQGPVWSEILSSGRAHVRKTIAASVGVWHERSAAVATAILIGDRAGIDADVERRLQKAGTYHVIAISGGNIAIFAALCLAFVRVLRGSTRAAALITIAIVSAHAALVQGGASVGRATVMAVLYLTARSLDHASTPLNIAALTAAIVFCALPLQIVDPGFALTFGATCGILAGLPLIDRVVPAQGWSRPVMTLLAATVCAELALMPVTALVFSRVTFAGLLVNVAAIPAMTLVQVGGMFAVALGSCGADRAARAVGGVVHAAVEVLIESSAIVDYMPSLTWRLAPPSLTVVILYYGALVTAVALVYRSLGRSRGTSATARMRRAVTAWMVVSVAAAAWILTSPVVRWPGTPRLLRVSFLDVGQGDSAIIQFPDGRTLMVDAGGSPGSRFDIGGRVVSPALWSSGVRRLDYLSITHGDADHIGGAVSVFEDVEPLEVWEGVPVPPHPPTRALRDAAEASGSAWRTLRSGDRVRFGDVELLVHHPPSPDWERQRVRNDDSQVIELRHGGVSIVLTGDISREVERAIAGSFQPAAVRVLKVPHHGSATSSSQVFLDSLRPDVAIISAGRGNPFGHPARQVVERYVKGGAAIFRTDRDGAVMLETDGTTLRVRTFIGRRLTLTTFGR